MLKIQSHASGTVSRSFCQCMIARSFIPLRDSSFLPLVGSIFPQVVIKWLCHSYFLKAQEWWLRAYTRGKYLLYCEGEASASWSSKIGVLSLYKNKGTSFSGYRENLETQHNQTSIRTASSYVPRISIIALVGNWNFSLIVLMIKSQT